jgi:hypothetical protein
VAVGWWADRALGGLRIAKTFWRVFFMTQSEKQVDHSLEERSLHLFKSERNEDLVAIGLAALLVLAVLLGVRV